MSGNRTDPVRSLIAGKIVAKYGATASLVDEIKQQADQVSSELDHAEAVVAKIDRPVIQQKKDIAHRNLDIALKKLSHSEAVRAPASVRSLLLEEVKNLYSLFKSADSDDEVSAMLDEHVKNFRQNKLAELNRLAELGDRAGAALKKANTCYCRGDVDACKTTETLKNETEHFEAMKAHQSAQAQISGASIGTSNGSSSVAAQNGSATSNPK